MINYKNWTIVLTRTHDVDTGLKLVEVLPCCSLYVVGKSYGVSLSWLIFEVIVHCKND
jgi:hypothetical protein